MASKVPKKHHYLPVFYLKGFSDPKSENSDKPDLWVYTQKQLPRKSTPQNEGYEKNANTLVLADGSRDTSVETGLAQNIDNPAALVIRKLEMRLEKEVTSDEIETLALFAGFLFARTPTGRYVQEKVSGPVAEKMMCEAAKRPGDFASLLRKETGTIPQNLEELRQEILAGLRHDPKEFALRSMIDLAVRYATRLSGWNWVFVYRQSDYEFVTCDNPFVTAIHDEVQQWTWLGMGLGHNAHVEVWLPLSRNVCAWISPDTDAGSGSIPSKGVRDINGYVMHCAQRHMYASHKSSALAKAFDRRGCKLIAGVNAHLPNPEKALLVDV